MVVARHEVTWLAPSTIWHGRLRTATPVNGSLTGPAIMRFNRDDFMDQFMTLAAYQPERMGEWLAQPESWHEPMKTPELSVRTPVMEPVSRRRQDLLGNIDAAKAKLPAIVPPPPDEPLKLYQPAQQRFYLATASLVCKERGLPDRNVDPGKQEQVGFALRRIVPPQTPNGDGDPNSPLAREYAFVATADGPRWQEIPPEERARVVENEERTPMFAVAYRDNERKRRLFAGLIPVAKREAYIGAARIELEPSDDSGEPFAERDPRRLFFEARVTEPWVSLVQTATAAALQTRDAPADIPVDPDATKEANQREAMLLARRNSIQTISWLALLDMAKFLEKYIKPVWDELNGVTPAPTLTDAQRQLVNAIEDTSAASVIARFKANGVHSGYSSLESNLRDALIAAYDSEDMLEAVEYSLALDVNPATPLDPDNPDPNQDWPAFLFPLANPPIDNNGVDRTAEADWAPLLSDTYLEAEIPAGAENDEIVIAKLTALAELVEKALPDAADQPLPELTMPQLEAWDNREPWFVLRCVYERPNCFPFESAVVSNPSQAFQIASFFDPDAPARPIRIPMPLDISPAGLRKYKRNTTIMMSDMLCGQVGRIKKITLADLVLSVLPWPFHKDLPKVGPAAGCKKRDGTTFGMFCSLSIPIVTLCAMILLIIMVALFDMFFKWIPLLFTCFSIPGLKGKKQNV